VGADADPAAVLVVPEIRDYQRINAELARRLDAGDRLVRLAGVEGQRLLVAGLRGPWEAVVEVDGDAGPELAAGLDAPGLTVVCSGRAADGAASGMRAGRLVVLGDAGPAVGYALAGGTVVVAGDAGPRAGLNQSGGVLVLHRTVGPLAGERQSGGRLFAHADRLGPHAGHGSRGGRFVRISEGAPLDDEDMKVLSGATEGVKPWLKDEGG
jgi:glutamate synthase domain-containing protein 3